MKRKSPNKKTERVIKSWWFDYDESADLLYVRLTDKLSSNHSKMREDGIILEYREKELVGLTILDASER